MTHAPLHTVRLCLLALIGMLLLVPMERTATAQSGDPAVHTVVLRDVPLDQALKLLADSTQTNLIYESHLVDGVRIFCSVREAPVEDLLRCMLSDTGLDYYRTSAGTYVLTASAAQPPQVGRLVGRVVDRDTGEPLPNANVMLADAGVGTATNDAGLFSFSSLLPGPYRVLVTYVGYESELDSVWIAPGGQRTEDFSMGAKTLIGEPIVISGLQQRLPSRGLGEGTLTEEALAGGLNSMGTADVARRTSSLLGVTLQEPLADLYLQGGAAGELVVRLDGMPVRSPVTLGQLLGAFSPLAIERLTMHKAGFGAAQGSFLSGTMALDHALGASSHQYVTVQADPLSVNARGQGSWGRPGGLQGSAMIAVRTSLWDAFREPALHQLLQDWHVDDPLLMPGIAPGQALSSASLQHHGEVAFSDLHLAGRLRFDPFHSLRLSLYRGHNRMDSETTGSPSTPDDEAEAPVIHTRDHYHWTNWAGRIRYEGVVGDRLLTSAALYRSHQSLGHGYGMDATGSTAPQLPYRPDGEDPYDGNWIDEIGLEAGAEYHLARRHHLSGALSLTRIASRALIENDFFRPLAYEDAQWQMSAFLQDEVSLGLGAHLELGTRLTYIPARQTVYAEPRGAVRYDGSSTLVGEYALRLAGGLYRQFVNQFDVSSTGPTALLPSLRFWLPTDHSHAPPRAYHAAADLLLMPGDPWTINLEAYYKWQPHLLDIDYPTLLDTSANGGYATGQGVFVSATRGRAYGTDMRIRYTSEQVEGSVSYSYSRSLREFPGRFEGRLQPSPWEQPHRLTLSTAVPLFAGLSAEAGWRSIWGRSWAYRRAYYDYLAPQLSSDGLLPGDFNEPGAQRLPPFHQLDLGLSYSRSWSDVAVTVDAQLINVLDRGNAFDWTLLPAGESFERFERTLPGRRPVLALRVSY